jgi:hypothetical protein
VFAATLIREIIAFIALMTDAASTSETSVNFYHTKRRVNPEDSHIHGQEISCLL